MSAVLTNDKSYKMSERLVKDMRHETVYVLNIDHKTPFSICPSFIFVGDRMLRNIIQYWGHVSYQLRKGYGDHKIGRE